jgi:hypothetical protein
MTAARPGRDEGASLASRGKASALRRRVFEILEHGTMGDRAGRLLNAALIGLITVNVVAVPLNMVPEALGDRARHRADAVAYPVLRKFPLDPGSALRSAQLVPGTEAGHELLRRNT